MGILTIVCFCVLSLLFLADNSSSHPQCIDSSEFLGLRFWSVPTICLHFSFLNIFWVVENEFWTLNLFCMVENSFIKYAFKRKRKQFWLEFSRLLGYPITLKSPLKFCPYNETSCCNATKDVHLQKQFQSMNVSDSACASVVKSILCAVSLNFSLIMVWYYCSLCKLKNGFIRFFTLRNQKQLGCKWGKGIWED